MKKTDIQKQQKPVYHLLAFFGRQVYALRIHLEKFNDWLDRKAGELWQE